MDGSILTKQMFHKSLLGKNVDYATRSVITAPRLSGSKSVDKVQVKFGYLGIPLSQVIVLFYPFFINYIQNYIEEHEENHVLYRVTPNFKEDNLLASGVEIEAYSVEDNGEGICFNVYIYNVQPEINIDYKTGKSWKN